MATQNREQVGWINCPMCKTRGTVHECARGKARKHTLYFRCRCGAIQPWTETGQAYITSNMQPMGPAPEPAPVTTEPEPPPEPPEPPADPPEKPRKSWLESLLTDEGEG